MHRGSRAGAARPVSLRVRVGRPKRDPAQQRDEGERKIDQ
jgi:hypothetical protein